MTNPHSQPLPRFPDSGFHKGFDHGYTDAATIAAASRLALAAAVLSGVGLVLLALI